MSYVEWFNKVRDAHQRLASPLVDDASNVANPKFLNTDLLWKEFELHVDLVKHYLDLIIKFNVFYYAVTGALLSYYFLNFDNNKLVRWSLIFPIMMSIFFGGLFLATSRAVPAVDEEIKNISQLLGFTKPEIRVLKYALIASGLLFLSIGTGIGFVFVIRR